MSPVSQEEASRILLIAAPSTFRRADASEMPFPGYPRLFNMPAVIGLEPGFGCYGIFDLAGTPIYVGCGEVRERLIDHLLRDKPAIFDHHPFFFMWVFDPDAEQISKDLIREYEPVCNRVAAEASA